MLELTGLKEREILIRAYVDNQSVVDALYSTKAVDGNDCIMTLELSSNKCKEMMSLLFNGNMGKMYILSKCTDEERSCIISPS